MGTMNELKFNSQVCTTKIQSQRLLDLGLSPYTSDMCWLNISGLPACAGYSVFEKAVDEYKLNLIPAWSLHRLLEMICNKECEEHYYFDFSIDYDSMVDVYNSIIEVIERHIKENRFNKKYLKQ